MTKQELLNKLKSYRGLLTEREQLLRRINEKKSDMYDIQAVVTDSVSVRSGEIADRVERVVEQIDGMVHYYLRKAAETEREEENVLRLIERVSDSEKRTILLLRYIEGKAVEEIAQITICSERCVWYRHNSAIEEILKKTDRPEVPVDESPDEKDTVA